MTDAIFDYSEKEQREFSANRALFSCVRASGIPCAVPVAEGTNGDNGLGELRYVYEDTVAIPFSDGRYLAINPSDMTLEVYKSWQVAPAGTTCTDRFGRVIC